MLITYTGRSEADSPFFTNAFSNNDVFSPDVTSITATELVLTNPATNWVSTFSGIGFGTNAENSVTEGTITSITIRDDNGDTVAVISNIGWDVSAFSVAMASSIDFGNALPLADLFNISSSITIDASGATAGYDMEEALPVANLITVPVTITGSQADDSLVGGRGNDSINVGADGTTADEILATLGNDTVDFSGSPAVAALDYSDMPGLTVVIDGAANTGIVNKGSAGVDTLVNVAGAMQRDDEVALDESVSISGLLMTGTADTDTFDVVIASGQTLAVFDRGGADTYNIAAQADAVAIISYNFGATQGAVVDLGAGSASNDGFGTTDAINLRGEGSLEIWGTDFNDVLTGGTRDDVFAGFAGNDVFNGGAGLDRVRYDLTDSTRANINMESGIVVGIAADVQFNDRISSIEWVTGSGGNDVITGRSLYFDIINGEEGNDRIASGGGRDQVYGGDGNDQIDGGTETDRLYGDAGNDIIYGGSNVGTQREGIFGGTGRDSLYGEAGFDLIRGGNDADYIDGGNQADNLYGDSGNDTLMGGQGLDRLFGGDGDDFLEGGIGSDGHFGELGNDTMNGGEGNDRFFGGDGNDLISGGSGVDTISGNAGFDTIDSGAGDDIVYGRFNADIFVFSDGDGQDTLGDFEATNDLEKIDLSAVSAITDFTDLSNNHMTQSGADVIIDTGSGNSIRLVDVTLADLDAVDFIL